MASTPGSTPGSTTPTPSVSTAPRTATSPTFPVAALQELVSQSVQTAVSGSFDSLMMSTLDARIRAALGTTPPSSTPPSFSSPCCVYTASLVPSRTQLLRYVRMCAHLLLFLFSFFTVQTLYQWPSGPFFFYELPPPCYNLSGPLCGIQRLSVHGATINSSQAANDI